MVAAWVLRDGFQVVSTEIRRGPESVQQYISSNLETSAEVVTKAKSLIYDDEKLKFRFRKTSAESDWVFQLWSVKDWNRLHPHDRLHLRYGDEWISLL